MRETFTSRPRKFYLVNFACHKPEKERMCTREIFMERSFLTGSFSEENLMFQKKNVERSGLGKKKYLEEAVLRVPPNPCMAEARKEAEGLVGPVNVVASGREVGGSNVHAVEDDDLIVF
jgi:3-ketoacyl-CoA synthase